jgi:hypothetical protein
MREERGDGDTERGPYKFFYRETSGKIQQGFFAFTTFLTPNASIDGLEGWKWYIEQIQNVGAAEIINGEVSVPADIRLFEPPYDKKRVDAMEDGLRLYLGTFIKAKQDKGDNLGINKFEKDVASYDMCNDVDGILSAQQYVLNALGKVGGPWSLTKPKILKRRNAAYSLRESVDTTVAYINEISDMIARIETGKYVNIVSSWC